MELFPILRAKLNMNEKDVLNLKQVKQIVDEIVINLNEKK